MLVFSISWDKVKSRLTRSEKVPIPPGLTLSWYTVPADTGILLKLTQTPSAPPLHDPINKGLINGGVQDSVLAHGNLV